MSLDSLPGGTRCIRILENTFRRESQEGSQCRLWGRIEDLEGRAVREITLEDHVTTHNAFPGRGQACNSIGIPKPIRCTSIVPID